VDLGDHVLAVDDDRGAARRAQRDVEDGPLLGDVDRLASAKRSRSVSSVTRFFE